MSEKLIRDHISIYLPKIVCVCVCSKTVSNKKKYAVIMEIGD